ncbi:MAG: hypothetical protein ABL949_13855 [Fimbriimonadaceae bacterium]
MSRKLSTIELTVLGLTHLRGPCTIYAVMKELSMSESSYHKSRAGTAYSVSKRLLGFGLLEPAEGGENHIQITEAGVAAIQAWLAPPLPMQDIAHSADLIRLRFFFLSVLEPEERIAFIDSALAGLRQFLARCEALLPENEAIGDYFGVLATLSTVLETRARIEWLKIVRKWVENPLGPEEKWSETVLKGFLND